LRAEFRRMKGVKANFTDVRISAMEDFLGRGDRRLSAVLRRAWELGAGMDSWFDSLEKAYNAWGEAIAQSDLTWKYRLVEQGEWNLANGQTGEELLNQPLPWDHIDTGIEKNWLKTDLAKALEAATVPDCSFEGCSHCGVCGTDFGHNIVVAPPPIPEFVGEFVPNQHKAQRLRVWFGKLGDMALVSHLDLARLFDRSIRRAAIPVTFTGGFHPSPRISIANALSLGSTSVGEIVDFELTEVMEISDFQTKLAAQLPENIPIYRVQEVDLKTPAATQLLEKAEYLLTVATDTEVLPAQWREWIAAVFKSDRILLEHTTKSGKKVEVNLRDRLLKLEPVFTETENQPQAQIRYLGNCRNDGNLLRPEHIVYMLEQVTGTEFQLLHAHRTQLILEPV